MPLINRLPNFGSVPSNTPDGSTFTPINEVLTDDNTMLSLTMNENSMKYLARSTDFANELCNDEIFMTYIGQSAYVDNTVLNSEVWVEKLKASPYRAKVS